MSTRTITDVARERGSAATTRAGAWRYLRAQIREQTSPLDGQVMRGYGYTYDGARGVAAKRRYLRMRLDARYMRRAADIARDLGLWDRDAMLAEVERLDAKITETVAGAIRSAWPFRTPSGRWAGGDTQITVHLAAPDKVDVRGGAERVWSDNGKWSGNNLCVGLWITRRAIETMPLVRDGLVILDHRDDGTYVVAAQGAGLTVKTATATEQRGRLRIVREPHEVAPRETHTRYKAVARTEDGTLRSIYSGEEYALGRLMTEAARTDHSGGYYCYSTIEAARGVRVPDCSKLRDASRVIVECRVAGRCIEYDGGKEAWTYLRPVAVVEDAGR